VREEADIVEIIGEFVKLKRVGNSFRGPCPFHQGKHDNFSVIPSGGYNCFVCGEKGNVFTFVQKRLGLDFVEAVKWVGAKVGVEVRDVSARQEGPDPRDRLWETNAAAAEHFRRQLWDEKAGAPAREYLASRGLGREQCERFGLGFAPREDTLRAHLKGLGFDDDRQVAAGVLVRREDSTEPRARFRNRLMFPIYDLRDHVAGFGGRVIGEGEPKYLNSAESEIFSKRRLLYGLNWAKNAVRKADRLLLVEGYFDVIRLVLAGIEEVVAPLGTSLTEAQASLIRKYTRQIILLYDSDAAGQKATFRAGDELLRNGMRIRVITLPEGEDPDTFVARHGAAGLERSVSDAIDVFERKLQILERGGWFGDLRKKREALDKLLPTIRVTADRLTRDLYIARTSEVAGVSRELIVEEVQSGDGPSAGWQEEQDQRDASSSRSFSGAGNDVDAEASREGRAGARGSHVRPGERRTNRAAEGIGAERELVRLLLHLRRYLEPVSETVGAELFQDRVYRRIFSELVSLGPDAGPGEITGSFDEESLDAFQELMEASGGFDHAAATIEACVNRIISRDDRHRLSQIDREMKVASEDEKDDLTREKQLRHGRLRELKQNHWKQFRPSRS
jgi:DNA primase